MNVESLLDSYAGREWRTVDEDDGEVRFALIGLGWWTIDHVLPVLDATDLCRATVCVSSSPSKAEDLKADYESVERAITYEAFHAGQAVEAYDAVYVCTPNATHLRFVETAARLGKDVLCEKPMEASVERAESLVETCADGGVTLMVGYRMHTEPAVRHARELVRGGMVGDPVLVHGENSQPLLDMIPDPDQWRLTPELTGYGTSVMDLGIYRDYVWENLLPEQNQPGSLILSPITEID